VREFIAHLDSWISGMRTKKCPDVLDSVLRSSDVVVRFGCIGDSLLLETKAFLLDPADASLTSLDLC
jgi:hypothetical protein